MKKTMISSKILTYINDSSFDTNLRKRILEWSKKPSFVNFLNNNKNKILKKLRTAQETEDKRDVGLELYVAFIFTTSNCEVIYEPNLPIPKKPDFKIRFDNIYFFCEVKRLRNWIDEILAEEMYRKCGDTICEKAIQSVPNEINIIYIRTRNNLAPDYNDFEGGFENLFKWIEENPKEFLKKIRKFRIRSIEEFKTYWMQVSSVIIPKVKNGKFIPTIWNNPNAAKPLPDILKLKISEAIQKPFRYDEKIITYL